jgi:hypothetical protein
MQNERRRPGKLWSLGEEVRMARTAVGWRSHSGWAVLVALRGPVSFPQILARRRIELVDDSLPRQPYHAVAEEGLSLRAGEALIARVEKTARAAAIAATESVRNECGVDVVGVVGRVRVIPDDLEKILASHALLHAAEGDLYERVLIDAATHIGLNALVLEPASIEIPAAVESGGKTLGPPWQKDHKLAAGVGLAALERKRY